MISIVSNYAHPLQDPLKLTHPEAKRNVSVTGRTVYQVENQVARMDLLHQAATAHELRTPFLQERYSFKAYYLDLLVPCHRGDMLVERVVAKRAPPQKRLTRSATQSPPPVRISEDAERALDSVMVKVPLVKLDYLPTAANASTAFSVYAAQMLVMRKLVMQHILRRDDPVPRTTWFRPTEELMLESGWEPMLSCSPLSLTTSMRSRKKESRSSFTTTTSGGPRCQA